MITVLIHLLVWFLVLSVVFWIVKIAASQFGAPAFVVQIVGLILLLIFVLAMLNAIGALGPAWRITP